MATCDTIVPFSPFTSMFQSSALRRFQSLPVPFCDFDCATPEVCHSKPKLSLLPASPSPSVAQSPEKAALCFGDEDECSQDSGVSECSGTLVQELAAPNFLFVQPLRRPPSRRVSRVLSDETNNPVFSPTASPHSSFASFRLLGSPSGSPVKLQRSSLTSCDDEDDSFLELADLDDLGLTTEAPKSISGLFTNPMVQTNDDDDDDTFTLVVSSSGGRCAFAADTSEDQENRLPSGSKSKRGLFRSPGCTRTMQRKCATFCGSLGQSPLCPNVRQMKRADPDSNTPLQIKRRKSTVDNTKPDADLPAPGGRALLQRCHSAANHSDVIKSAMTRREDNDNLIGDLSRAYALPLCRSKHQDLKAISAETMAAVLRGVYADKVHRAIIVDARYPYEFHGGHLQGALNLYTMDEILTTFPVGCRSGVPVDKHTIVIFHCEFSSERGPKMCRFLRNKDRDANRDNYPALDYPELYLLEGGYKAFFYSQDQMLCEPPTYKPMLHENHADDLRLFRAKSKSWAGEKPGRKGSRVPFRPGQGLKL